MGQKQSNPNRYDNPFSKNINKHDNKLNPSKSESNFFRTKTTTSNNNSNNVLNNNNYDNYISNRGRINTTSNNNSGVIGTFVCPKCNKVFYNSLLYNQHCSTCNDNLFSNNNNQINYTNFNTYNNNIDLDLDNNNDLGTFICTKCYKVFYSRNHYNNHISQCRYNLNSNINLNKNNNNNIQRPNNNLNRNNNNLNRPNNNLNRNNNNIQRPNNNLNRPNNNLNRNNNNNIQRSNINSNRNINIQIPNNNLNRNNMNLIYNDNLFDIGNFIQTQLLKEPKKILPRGKSDGTFDEKVQYLRYNLQEKKIDWTIGSDKISINRENILEDSISQFKKINPFKELKIEFKGEISLDAGGLIREWLTVLFNILLDEKTNLFEKSDTDEISYIIKKSNIKNSENDIKYEFIGKLLGKALLENLTVNCCFNKIIYQLFLNEKITLNDLVFIDKPLYNSLKNLIEMKNNGEDLSLFELYFSIQYYENNKFITDELIENGNNILVTSDNLNNYIEKRIEYLIKTQKNSVELIKKGFNSIIPLTELKIFNSDQLSLLINGTPFIDIDDWRINTIYKNYNEYDNVIINFWEILSNLSQNDLSNFLLFCTGSSRVPIGGFKTLESNRGNVSKFCITKCEYISNQKNFIRAHTCFNRLDLPNFPNEKLLNDAIKFALENEILGFGIE